ncbi:MAG: transporter substrate-binding domain-containing protein [Holosporales bacterium]|jgi:polar amino acid transport system substrate-binding protein|nr:transporter substrate-binding domain-containing protein [Holosporales bacterium]
MLFVKNIATISKALLCIVLSHSCTVYCSSPKNSQNKLIIESRANEEVNEKKIKPQRRNPKDIAKSGYLKVCIKELPKSQADNKNSADFLLQLTDVGFAKKMAEGLGVKKLIFVYGFPTYDAVITAVEQGKGDIGISNLSYTKERSRKVQFSTPYLAPMRQTLLIDRKLLHAADNASLVSILNNDTVTIGTDRGTCYPAMSQKLFPAAKLVPESDWEYTVVQDFKSGKIRATMRDELRIKLLIQQNPSLLFKFIPIMLKDKPDFISVAIEMENVALLEWINTFIRNACNPLSVDEIIKFDGVLT